MVLVLQDYRKVGGMLFYMDLVCKAVKLVGVKVLCSRVGVLMIWGQKEVDGKNINKSHLYIAIHIFRICLFIFRILFTVVKYKLRYSL